MKKRFTPIAVAAVMALSIVTPALAASTDVTETFQVGSAFSVTGIPSSFTYTKAGGLLPGDVSDVQDIAITVTGNSGYYLRLSGTDFAGTGTNAGATISKGYREFTLNGGESFLAFDSIPSPDGTVASGDIPPVGGDHYTLGLRLTVPGNAPSGGYTGTVTIAVVAG